MRTKLWIVTLAAAVSLLGGAQALAPAPAAAMDDLNELSECTQGTDWSYVDDVGEDCSEGGGGGQPDAGVPTGGEPPSDGRNEIIEVEGTAPETGSGSGVHPVGGPRPSQSSRGADGQSRSGLRGGGASGGSASDEDKSKRPPFRWPHWNDHKAWRHLVWLADMCKANYKSIQRFYDEDRKISRGELGFLRWFFTGGKTARQMEDYFEAWKQDHCSEIYPTTVY